MVSRVLIVAAHPDDEVLGCGGFLSKFKDRFEFSVTFIAEGVSARFAVQEINSPPVLEAIERRNSDCLQAMKLFNIDKVSFHGLTCGRLDTVPIIEINKIIEREIGKFRPDLILTHFEHDCNNDHRIVFRSVMMATRPNALNCVPIIGCFEVVSSSEWNFEAPFSPNYFESISEENLQTKIDALTIYGEELRNDSHPRSSLGLHTQAIMRGFQSGVQYAEAYKIIRAVGR